MDKEIWDDMAIDYDKSVEDNQDPIIVNYLKKEIEILITLCNRVYDSRCKCSSGCSGVRLSKRIFS